ncbi:GNAT family N-acetyltransferase [Oleomonas cavernae]|uniref:GNAT family N-acetyltransferase n=1 Tax=Oleomonas cavernae TaxID=2320859 RepID=A0A418WFP6_9PROT|nr:GNAT family N-acetyltransferase [Oleomonas cavernae]RJF88833.1 GNAT family N-acetyltransferase [Oleomonas cavernae]
MALRIAPLGDHHDRAVFDCGVEALDRYLKTQAGQDSRKRVASCFVLTDDGPAPIAFYTLAATAIALTDLPPPLAKKLPRYPAVPATLMGRLAVDRRFRGRRLGEFMLMDAFSRTLRSEIATYAFVVDAKDEAAERFYKAYQFLPLAAAQRRLFIPMTEVARLFA